jgi:hypothetical protein
MQVYKKKFERQGSATANIHSIIYDVRSKETSAKTIFFLFYEKIKFGREIEMSFTVVII